MNTTSSTPRGSPRSTAPPRASRRGRSGSWSGARWSSSARSPDPLPAELVSAETLLPFDRAIRQIHFPASQEELHAAEERLKFDELFTLELGVAFRKHRVEAAEQRRGARARRTRSSTGSSRRSRSSRPARSAARWPRSGGDGPASADEPAPPGRRRFRQDPGRAPRRARRDRLRASGGDHGSHGDSCSATFPVDGRPARAVRCAAVPGARRRVRPAARDPSSTNSPRPRTRPPASRTRCSRRRSPGRSEPGSWTV